MTDDRAEAARPRPRRDGALRTPLWEALQYCHDAAIRLAEQLDAALRSADEAAEPDEILYGPVQETLEELGRVADVAASAPDVKLRPYALAQAVARLDGRFLGYPFGPGDSLSAPVRDVVDRLRSVAELINGILASAQDQ